MKKGVWGRKGSVVTDYLPWILLGVAVLVMLMIATFVQQGVLDSYIDKVRNPFG